MTEELTAVDYLQNQLELEREARELMPYDPDSCTYPKALRQIVFACLSCLRANNGSDVGVCYLCLIQCHSTHELVELFSKRDFVCDCGTTRMENGAACKLRLNERGVKSEGAVRLRTGSMLEQRSFGNERFSSLDLKAKDIPSLGNTYNHNFKGRFCSCGMVYNPIQETRTMHQCYFGESCGEDWFHQDCILGYKPGIFVKGSSGMKKLSLFSSAREDFLIKGGVADERAEEKVKDVEEEVKQEEEEVKQEEEEEVKQEEEEEVDEEANSSLGAPEDSEKIPHFPELHLFSEFICWKCVAQYQEAFGELPEEVGFKFPHLNQILSAAQWKEGHDAFISDEPPLKKRKESPTLYSVFLKEGFKSELANLQSQPGALGKLLKNYEFLAKEDPIYQPPEDSGSPASSTGSLFEMGTNALLSLPIPQAIEGLQAYGMMKSKLKDFFQGFVEQGKVVTEEEVREFFGNMKK